MSFYEEIWNESVKIAVGMRKDYDGDRRGKPDVESIAKFIFQDALARERMVSVEQRMSVRSFKEVQDGSVSDQKR